MSEFAAGWLGQCHRRQVRIEQVHLGVIGQHGGFGGLRREAGLLVNALHHLIVCRVEIRPRTLPLASLALPTELLRLSTHPRPI